MKLKQAGENIQGNLFSCHSEPHEKMTVSFNKIKGNLSKSALKSLIIPRICKTKTPITKNIDSDTVASIFPKIQYFFFFFFYQITVNLLGWI